MSSSASTGGASQDLPSLKGTLQVYQRDPTTLTYHDSDPFQPHTLIFIPGLTDTLLSAPYIPLLSATLKERGWSIVQPQLTSNMSGWGCSTLEGDAQEMARCVAHLRSLPAKRGGKVVVMGHSTGCQDAITYALGRERIREGETRIDGLILQAPVSDREEYEYRLSNMSEGEREWEMYKMDLARQLLDEGRGGEVLPRYPPPRLEEKGVASASMPPTDPFSPSNGGARGDGNGTTTLSPPLTAYRFLSLYAKGGDDDLFSSSLSNDQLTSTKEGTRSIGHALSRLQSTHGDEAVRILTLHSEADEYVPPSPYSSGSEAIAERWNNLFESRGGLVAKVLRYGANHKVDQVEAQRQLVGFVDEFVAALP